MILKSRRSCRWHSPWSWLCRVAWAEPIPPQQHRFVPDVDAALMQQVRDVAQRQRKTDVQHYRKADDFQRRFEMAERIGLVARLSLHSLRLKPICSDTATNSAIGRPVNKPRRRTYLKRPFSQLVGRRDTREGARCASRLCQLWCRHSCLRQFRRELPTRCRLQILGQIRPNLADHAVSVAGTAQCINTMCYLYGSPAALYISI